MKRMVSMALAALFVVAMSGCCCRKGKCCSEDGTCPVKPSPEKADL